MSAKHLLLAAIMLLTAWLTPQGPAKASEVMLDASGFISGTQSFVDTFDVGTAGTLTVTLSDIGWPGPIKGLNFFVTSANTVLAPMSGPGSEVISVGPGAISVHWFGQGSGPLQLGLFGIDCQFEPSLVTAVPLPTSLLLLASALAAILFSRWDRRSQVHAC